MKVQTLEWGARGSSVVERSEWQKYTADSAMETVSWRRIQLQSCINRSAKNRPHLALEGGSEGQNCRLCHRHPADRRVYIEKFARSAIVARPHASNHLPRTNTILPLARSDRSLDRLLTEEPRAPHSKVCRVHNSDQISHFGVSRTVGPPSQGMTPGCEFRRSTGRQNCRDAAL